MKFARTSLTLAVAALSATSLFAATSTDYDHHINFRTYKTFSFYKVQTSDPLFEQRVRTK